MAGRRLRRGLVVAAVLVAAVIAGTWVSSRSPSARGQLRAWLERQAAATLDGTVTIGRVDGTLWRGLELVDVRFSHDGREVVRVGRIEAGYRLWALLRGQRALGALRLVDPVLRLRYVDGRWDASRWLRTRPAGGVPATLTLPDVRIVNGRIEADAAAGIWRVPPVIDTIHAQLALAVGAETDVTLSAVSAAAGAGWTVTAGRGHVRMGTGVRLDDVTLETSGGAVALSGQIGVTPGRAAMKIALSRFDTVAWRRFTPALDEVRVVASGMLAISGPPEARVVTADLATSAGRIAADLRVRQGGGPADAMQVTGTAALTAVDLEAFTGRQSWASSITTTARVEARRDGHPTRWRATLGVSGGPVRVFGWDADRLEGTVRYVPDGSRAPARLTLDGRVSAYGAHATLALAARLDAAVAVDVTATHLAGLDPRRLPAAWGVPGVEAHVAAARVDLTWSRAAWAANVTLADSTVEGASVGAGTTILLGRDARSATLEAAGPIASADVRRLGRAFALEALDDPRLASQLTGRVTVRGRGADFTHLDLDGSATLAASALTGVRTPGGDVEWRRQGHTQTLAFAGAVADLDPVRLGLPEGFEGVINGRLTTTAEWHDDAPDIFESMTARFTLDAGPSHFARLDVSRGRLVGRWAAGELTAETLQLEGAGVHLTGQGRLGILHGSSQASYAVTADDVIVLEPWTGRRTHGAARGGGEVTGPFDAPRITGTMRARRLDDAELGAFVTADGTWDVVLPDWDVEVMQGPVTGRAAEWQGDRGVVATDVTVTGPLTSWTTMRGTFSARSGPIALSGAFLADWAHESMADITAFAATNGGQTWRLTPGAGSMSITETHFHAVGAALVNGRQRVTLTGALAFAALEPEPVGPGGHASDRISAHVEELDLAGAAAFLGLTGALEGVMSGDGMLVGRLDDPRGRVAVTARALALRGYRIDQISSIVSFEAGAANVTVGLRQTDGVRLNVMGCVPLAWALPAGALDPSVPVRDWDLAAVSDPIELAIFAPVLPMLNALAGQALIDLRVIGAADDPRVTGTVAVTGGAFAVPALGTSFARITADVGFAEDAVSVRRFVAWDQHGHRLNVTGRLAVAGRQVTAFNVSIEADRLSLLQNRVGDVEISSLLRLSGDLTHPTLTGNVEVTSARIELDRVLRVLQGEPLAVVTAQDWPDEGETRVDVRPPAAPEADGTGAAPAPAPWLSRLAIDVDLFAPDSVILRGRRLRPSGRDGWSFGDLSMTVGGELSATRAAGEAMRLRGDVAMVRGAYAFEGRRFELQRGGRVRFQGESPIDPALDIRAVRQIQGVEARVDVRGRLSAPQLVLGADVPIDQADVLSMIIFNRPVNQLGDAQRAGLVDAAASLAGGMVAAPIVGRIGRALDLDVLDVETVSLGQAVAPRVRVGEQIGRRLYLQLSQQFGAQSVSEVTAEYQLTRWLRLQGRTAQGPGSSFQRSLLQRVERAGLNVLFFFSY